MSFCSSLRFSESLWCCACVEGVGICIADAGVKEVIFDSCGGDQEGDTLILNNESNETYSNDFGAAP